MGRRPIRIKLFFATAVVAGLLLIGGATACGPASGDPPAAGLPDMTTAAGVDFVHTDGASGKKFLFETMGSGVAVADFNGDDAPDVLFLQAGTLPTTEFTVAEREAAQHAAGGTARLYLNAGA